MLSAREQLNRDLKFEINDQLGAAKMQYLEKGIPLGRKSLVVYRRVDIVLKVVFGVERFAMNKSTSIQPTGLATLFHVNARSTPACPVPRIPA